MIRTELSEIYNSPWGVLHSRREQAEKAAYGKFEEVIDKAVAEDFLDIGGVALAMGCCSATATKRLRKSPVRYIEHKGKYWYLRDDVNPVIASHAQS